MGQKDLKLVIALARAHSTLFSKLEKQLDVYNITLSEFGVLEFLYHKGPHPIQAIAEKILVTSGTITYIIDKLSRRGLVVRVKCEKDKRVYYIELTKEGSQLIAEIFPKHEAYLKALFGDLDDNKKETLIQLLFELKEVM